MRERAEAMLAAEPSAAKLERLPLHAAGGNRQDLGPRRRARQTAAGTRRAGRLGQAVLGRRPRRIGASGSTPNRRG